MSEDRSATRPLTVAVVGATGLVGQTMTQLLLEREFPVADFRPLASRADGRTVDFGGRKVPVAESGPDAFNGVDIALFSAGVNTSGWAGRPRVLVATPAG